MHCEGWFQIGISWGSSRGDLARVLVTGYFHPCVTESYVEIIAAYFQKYQMVEHLQILNKPNS